MQIVQMNLILDGIVAVFVGGTILQAAFDTTARAGRSKEIRPRKERLTATCLMLHINSEKAPKHAISKKMFSCNSKPMLSGVWPTFVACC